MAFVTWSHKYLVRRTQHFLLFQSFIYVEWHYKQISHEAKGNLFDLNIVLSRKQTYKTNNKNARYYILYILPYRSTYKCISWFFKSVFKDYACLCGEDHIQSWGSKQYCHIQSKHLNLFAISLPRYLNLNLYN